MRILLLGKSGQLGWELQRSLAPLGELIAVGRSDNSGVDFTQPRELAVTVRSLAPDIIVNAAAYTAVDRAESEVQTVMAVNAVAPGLLSQVAVELDAWLIHYSTDYVFDGSGTRPWRESDNVGPLNTYGRSKLAGEENIRASGCKSLIFRTSWVYATRGDNFAKTILKLAQERTALKVINDQFGVPTGADLLSDVTAHALRAILDEPELAGTYHVAPQGETTWHAYAQHVILQARKSGLPIRVRDEAIEAVETGAFPTPARRPANSRMCTDKFRKKFNLYLPEWQMGVDRMLQEVFQK